MRKNKRLFIVIPCYNEAAVLPETSKMFLEELFLLIEKGKIAGDSRILFVDNASEDETWQIISGLAKADEHYLGIRQSKNRGHQSNVLAGLMEVKEIADMAISVDCDGQDDITAMERMVDAYHEGYEVVYGVRESRKTDSFMKRNTAQLFYKLLNAMGAEVVYNHADYRLTSSRVLQEFAGFEEVNLYLRGLFPLVGFKSTSVYYERHERMAGKSHYGISHLFGLAFDGITSLSVKPLHLITSMGGIAVIASLIGIIWTLIGVLQRNVSVTGWASTVCIILFLGGVQLVSLGVIGEYIGKIYLEVKHRPRFIISDKTYEEMN